MIHIHGVYELRVSHLSLIHRQRSEARTEHRTKQSTATIA